MWRRQRRSIEVKPATKLGKCRQLGVEAGAPKQVQSEFGLGQSLPHKCKGKLHANRTFCGVPMMQTRGHKLKIEVNLC